MITLNFEQGKKIICCNGQWDGKFGQLKARYSTSEIICKALGTVQTSLQTMSALAHWKNHTTGSFADGFMDAYDDFLTDFGNDLEGLLNTTYTDPATIAGLVSGLNQSVAAFTNVNVLGLES